MTRLICLAAVAAAVAAATPGVATQTRAVNNPALDATALYCQVGGIGLQPSDATERFFAKAVIEVNAAAPVQGAKVATFELIDATGVAHAAMRRVTDVLEFTRPRIETEGIAAHFGNTSGNSPWSGTLLPGITRLQIHVSFDRYPAEHDLLDLRCRIGFSSLVVVRGIDAVWPT